MGTDDFVNFMELHGMVSGNEALLPTERVAIIELGAETFKQRQQPAVLTAIVARLAQEESRRCLRVVTPARTRTPGSNPAQTRNIAGTRS